MKIKIIIAGAMGAILAADGAHAAGEGVVATEAFVRSAYAQGKTYAAGVAATAETNAKSYTNTELAKINSFSGSYDDLENKPVFGDIVTHAASEFATTGALSSGLAEKQDNLPAASGNNGKVLGVVNDNGTIGWVDQSTTDISGMASLQTDGTAGNIATLDAKGQYVDSGTALSGLETKLAGATGKVMMGDGGTGYQWVSTSSDTFVE